VFIDIKQYRYFRGAHPDYGDITVNVIPLLVTPEREAVISVCPGFNPVARPAAEIVAISVYVLIQFT
jgi:hypothetical protein